MATPTRGSQISKVAIRLLDVLVLSTPAAKTRRKAPAAVREGGKDELPVSACARQGAPGARRWCKILEGLVCWRAGVYNLLIALHSDGFLFPRHPLRIWRTSTCRAGSLPLATRRCRPCSSPMHSPGAVSYSLQAILSAGEASSLPCPSSPGP